MRNRLVIALALATLSLAGNGAHAQTSTWTIDPSHSSINFEVRHLGVSNVHGSLGRRQRHRCFMTKKTSPNRGSKLLPIRRRFRPNVERRDQDLKSPNFFDVQKYPQLSFKSTRISNAGGKLTMTGDLTLNGVTKSITLDVDGPAPAADRQERQDSQWLLRYWQAEAQRLQLRIRTPSAVVGDDVKFSIDVEIDKQ